MKGTSGALLDPLASASSATATVIAINKPIYPLYVWWLAPDAFKASLLTMIFFPVYAAVPFIARRHSLASRVTMLAAGTVDTLMITKLMGEASGSWLFLTACIVLSASLFYDNERWIARAATALVFLLFAVSHHHYGAPYAVISEADLDTLFTLNTYGVFALLAFIVMRFPRIRKM